MKKLLVGLSLLASMSSFADVVEFELSSYASDIDFPASRNSMGRRWVKSQARFSLEDQANNKCRGLNGEFVRLEDITLVKISSYSTYEYAGSAKVKCRLKAVGICAVQLRNEYSLASDQLAVTLCNSNIKKEVLHCVDGYLNRPSQKGDNLFVRYMKNAFKSVSGSDIKLCKTAVSRGYDVIFRTLLITTPHSPSDLLKATDIVVKQFGITDAKERFLEERRKANVPEELLVDLY